MLDAVWRRELGSALPAAVSGSAGVSTAGGASILVAGDVSRAALILGGAPSFADGAREAGAASSAAASGRLWRKGSASVGGGGLLRWLLVDGCASSLLLGALGDGDGPLLIHGGGRSKRVEMAEKGGRDEEDGCV